MVREPSAPRPDRRKLVRLVARVAAHCRVVWEAFASAEVRGILVHSELEPLCHCLTRTPDDGSGRDAQPVVELSTLDSRVKLLVVSLRRALGGVGGGSGGGDGGGGGGGDAGGASGGCVAGCGGTLRSGRTCSSNTCVCAVALWKCPGPCASQESEELRCISKMVVPEGRVLHEEAARDGAYFAAGAFPHVDGARSPGRAEPNGSAL
eukprot:6180096-Pleurochrysis_carterae.AAC.2